MPKDKLSKKTVKTAVKKTVKKPKTDAETVTEIVCVVDRSGSMEAIKSDAIGGFNNFLTDQKKQPGSAIMTIVLFDHQYEIMCSGKPVNEVVPLTTDTFVPRGSTALLDAIGRTIVEVNKRNPSKAIITILTDGQENSSHEFTKQQVKQMTDDCEKKGWAIIYLSADANAFEDGKSYGVGASNIMSFAATPRGTNVCTMAASYAASDYRQSGNIANMSVYSARAGSFYDSSQSRTAQNTKKTLY